MFARSNQRRGLSGLAVFLFCTCLSASAQAGNFQVGPLRVLLSAGQRVVAVTVRNDGEAPTVIQLEAVSWSQNAGNDVYAPTKELLATPPIFTLLPGGSQLIRVGLRRAQDPRAELSYRLFMQEVPPPPRPGFHGLQVALRIGIPVFVAPAVKASPLLRWRASASAPGQIKLIAINDGTAHVQIVDFKLMRTGEVEPLAVRQLATYVLPGQSHEWVIDVRSAATAGSALKLLAQTNVGDAAADLILAGAP